MKILYFLSHRSYTTCKVDNTIYDGNKGKTTKILPHSQILQDRNNTSGAKASIIFTLMSHREIGGIHVMSLEFKWVVIIVICLRINATKVVLKIDVIQYVWEARLILFNAMVVQVFLYGVDA